MDRGTSIRGPKDTHQIKMTRILEYMNLVELDP